jgi:hypothetical protein
MLMVFWVAELIAKPAPYLAVAGATGGVVFWLIRRPDRDTALTLPPSPQTGAS